MRMIVRAALAAAVLGGAACAAPRAEAAVIVTVVQSGGNVVMTASGSINLAGLSGPTNIGNPYGSVTIYPNNSVGLSVGTASASVDEYTTTFTTSTATYPFISQQSTLLTSTFNVGGQDFAINTDLGGIVVPTGYTSGSALSGSATFDGTTLSKMGLTSGTYTASWGSGTTADSVTLEVGSAVPEPATFALLLLPLTALGLARRRG